VRPKFIDYYCPYTLGGHFINACNKDGEPVCGIYVKVSVERLNDISEQDAIAEGIDTDWLAESQDNYDCIADHNMSGRPTAKGHFSYLWQSIYGDDKSKCWEKNPWVWVIEFKRVQEQRND
ncbi:hypothetical protein HMPREF0454_03749, partial [Hafnia alvei ATCC 51873]